MTKIENLTELKGFLRGFGVFGIREGENTFYGLIAPDGRIVLGPHPSGNLCDEEGNPIEEYRHDKIYSNRFSEGYSIVEHGKNGHQRIRISRDSEGNYSVAEVKDRLPQWVRERRYKFEAFSLKGRLITHEDVFSFGPVGDYLRLKLMDGESYKQILTDEYFRPILPDVYDQVADDPYVSSGTPFSVRQGEDWFVINLSGERLSEKRYDYLESFTSDGYAIFGERISDVVETDECDEDETPEMRYRFGLIDIQERVIIPPIYETLCWIDDDCRELNCSTGMDSCGGLFGVLDCAGNCIIPQIYTQPLTKGPANTYIASAKEGAFPNGLLGSDGKILLPFRDWEIESYGDVVRVYDDETECYGLYSPAEGWLMSCEYDVMDIGDTLDYIAVCKNGEWYYVNRYGVRVLL